VHPAAGTLVNVARAQNSEVGDRTTSAVLLAAQLLKEVLKCIEEGVSYHIIMKGFRRSNWFVLASSLAVSSFDLHHSLGRGEDREDSGQG
jgi:chaperonin GroEL (HSP60 family)